MHHRSLNPLKWKWIPNFLRRKDNNEEEFGGSITYDKEHEKGVDFASGD